MGNETPKYGASSQAYPSRFGAAVADLTSQNFFSDALLACWLRQDPRYFRKGPQSRILARLVYSLSRMALARQDSSRQTFNASGVFGMMLGIGTSNLYYPSASRTSTVMAVRLSTSVMAWAIGNVGQNSGRTSARSFLPTDCHSAGEPARHRPVRHPPLPP
jgi:hypothetical protein